jgi:hypothetical protein
LPGDGWLGDGAELPGDGWVPGCLVMVGEVVSLVVGDGAGAAVGVVWWRDGDGVPPEVLAVASSYSAIAVHHDLILMVLHDLDHHACAVPFDWVVASLVLHQYSVSAFEGERPLVCSVQRFLPRDRRFCSVVCLVCCVIPS